MKEDGDRQATRDVNVRHHVQHASTKLFRGSTGCISSTMHKSLSQYPSIISMELSGFFGSNGCLVLS